MLSVLHTMVNHKAAHYDAEADYTLARLLRCFAPMMTGAVDSSAHLPPAFEGESAVDRLKRRLKWRDAATEARWVKRTGWNLLTMGAMLDDVAAVRELCAQPNAHKLLTQSGRWLRPKSSLQRQPFSSMLLMMSSGHLPLYGAMGYASTELLTIMLQVRSGGRHQITSSLTLVSSLLSCPPLMSSHLDRPTSSYTLLLCPLILIPPLISHPSSHLSSPLPSCSRLAAPFPRALAASLTFCADLRVCGRRARCSAADWTTRRPFSASVQTPSPST